MEFTLSREQQMARSMFREFAEREVEPLAAQVDKEEMFPEVTIKKMAKLGMMGIYFPKEYGGAGADVLTYAMCIEELAKKCATTGVILSGLNLMKGLEFDAVAVVWPDNAELTDDERRRRYTACSRALHALTVLRT